MKNPKHNIPSINISPLSRVSKDEVLSYSPVVNAIMDETPKAIEHALNTRKDTATIIEINKSGAFIDIQDKWWVNALTKCLKRQEDTQNYEKCSYIRNLINRVETSRIPTTEKLSRIKKK